MDTRFEFASHNEADTHRFGGVLAEAVRAGDVIALHGPLGAGKTRLVQAVAKRLGCERQLINSPTFVLLQEYDGRLPVYHVDAYRLRGSDEFLEIGGAEILTGDGVCLIEWAEKLADLLPRDHLSITIRVVGEQSRMLGLEAGGGRAAELLQTIRTAL